MKRIVVGLIGYGTVGEGVARILLEQKSLLETRVGAEIVLKTIADLDIETPRTVSLPSGTLTTDATEILDDPEIDIVVEMVGGTGFAADCVRKALSSGKHVVTANKKLLAMHGNELFALAATHNVDIAYEASVGGCMPVIKTLRESLVGNRIDSMTGILNGTCNYILSRITEEGLDFETALKQAQESGFAEADPTLDIEGYDAAHKLAILASLAFGMEIKLEDVFVEGITRIEPVDIAYADQFGYRIKLFGIAKNHGDKVEARVHPAMIPTDRLLSNVNGSVNAISIHGDAVGEMILYGHGAGQMPTASAVIGDIVDISRDLMRDTTQRVPGLSAQPEAIRDLSVLPMDAIRTHYYLRFAVADQPGVLANIAGILGNHDISIMSVHQKERHISDAVPVVILTHRASGADMKRALEEIRALDENRGEPMVIRIEDPDANGEH